MAINHLIESKMRSLKLKIFLNIEKYHSFGGLVKKEGVSHKLGWMDINLTYEIHINSNHHNLQIRNQYKKQSNY